jgi:hypothetical protein
LLLGESHVSAPHFGDGHRRKLASLLSLQSAHAGPVDISAFVNADVTTYSSRDLYPQNGGALTVGGIGFNLATIAVVTRGDYNFNRRGFLCLHPVLPVWACSVGEERRRSLLLRRSKSNEPISIKAAPPGRFSF